MFIRVNVLFSYLILISVAFSGGNNSLENDLDKAISLMQGNNYASAEDILESPKFKQSKLEFEAENLLGLIDFNLDDRSKAVKHFLKSIELNETFAEPHNNIAYIYILNENYALAKTYLSNALRIKPNYTEAQNNLKLITQLESNTVSLSSLEMFRNANKETDITKAVKLYESLVVNHPKFKEVRNNLAVYYYYNGEIDRAERMLRTLVSTYPKYAEAYNNLGYIFFAQKKYNTSIRYFLTAVKLHPTYMVALNNLGDVYYENEAFNRAEKVWRTILTLQPYNETVTKKLTMLENDLKL